MSPTKFSITYLVSSHAMDIVHRRVTTTGKVTTSIANGHTLATNSSDAVLLSSLIDLGADNTSADLQGRARPRAGLERAEVLDALETMGPDGEGTSTDRATIEIMAGILDDKTQVQGAGKVDSQLDMGDIAGIDDI